MTDKQLQQGEQVQELLKFQAARARRYFEESSPLLDLIEKRSRPSLWALIEIYKRLLGRIERSNYDVYRRRIALPTSEKLWIVLRAAAKSLPG